MTVWLWMETRSKKARDIVIGIYLLLPLKVVESEDAGKDFQMKNRMWLKLFFIYLNIQISLIKNQFIKW